MRKYEKNTSVSTPENVSLGEKRGSKTRLYAKPYAFFRSLTDVSGKLVERIKGPR